jgi:serine/threonine protein kinase
MGVVLLGEDLVIGRPVAIKELRLPDGLGEHEREVYQERVLREARTTGRLNDPGVVTVFDVVSEDGSTFIVMELIQAPTLADLIREHGALGVEQALPIAEHTLSVLDTAHAAGVVHRDVKPSNIMVLPGGG